MSLKSLVKFVAISSLAIAFASGCNNSSDPNDTVGSPPIDQVQPDNLIVKARALVPVTISGDSISESSVNQSIPVQVINPSNVTVTYDTSAFIVPTISNTVLNFGSISISALEDNDLQICGTDGLTQCKKAVIRVYTTGTPLAGLYNAVGNYGMPVTVKHDIDAAKTVGLEVAGAAIVQTISIGAKQHVLNLSNFKSLPIYNIKSDFTGAGAGSYQTTLVVEYGLSL